MRVGGYPPHSQSQLYQSLTLGSPCSGGRFSCGTEDRAQILQVTPLASSNIPGQASMISESGSASVYVWVKLLTSARSYPSAPVPRPLQCLDLYSSPNQQVPACLPPAWCTCGRTHPEPAHSEDIPRTDGHLSGILAAKRQKSLG